MMVTKQKRISLPSKLRRYKRWSISAPIVSHDRWIVTQWSDKRPAIAWHHTPFSSRRAGARNAKRFLLIKRCWKPACLLFLIEEHHYFQYVVHRRRATFTSVTFRRYDESGAAMRTVVTKYRPGLLVFVYIHVKWSSRLLGRRRPAYT